MLLRCDYPTGRAPLTRWVVRKLYALGVGSWGSRRRFAPGAIGGKERQSSDCAGLRIFKAYEEKNQHFMGFRGSRVQIPASRPILPRIFNHLASGSHGPGTFLGTQLKTSRSISGTDAVPRGSGNGTPGLASGGTSRCFQRLTTFPPPGSRIAEPPGACFVEEGCVKMLDTASGLHYSPAILFAKTRRARSGFCSPGNPSYPRPLSTTA